MTVFENVLILLLCIILTELYCSSWLRYYTNWISRKCVKVFIIKLQIACRLVKEIYCTFLMDLPIAVKMFVDKL